MPYQANKPLANDQLSQSQQDINGNFVVLGSIGGNANPNSAGINTAPGAGFNYLFLPVNGGNPPLGTVFGASNAIYSFINPTSGRNTVYINQDTLAGALQIPSTASILGTATPASNSDGWTFLPSGILMKWGYVVKSPNPPNPQTPVNLNAGGNLGPNFAAVFSLQVTQAVTVAATQSSLRSPIVKLVGFQIQIGNNPDNANVEGYYWSAIGR